MQRELWEINGCVLSFDPCIAILKAKEADNMDQIKIGGFLKQLRKEKGLTQEALAERLLVSNRTVSRWETGSNMPDLDVLVELAKVHEVELSELLNGERSQQKMDKQLE